MAIDYIIGALQLLSAAVNVLALAAFWVTPGLRTTANRFVINLLVVNIVGCLVLTPALFLHGGLKPEAQRQTLPYQTLHSVDDTISETTLPFLSQNVAADKTRIQTMPEEIVTKCIEIKGKRQCDTVQIERNKHSTETFEKTDFQDDNGQLEIMKDTFEDGYDIDSDTVERIDTVVVDAAPIIDASTSDNIPTTDVISSDCTRFWGFDLVAALGKNSFNIYLFLFIKNRRNSIRRKQQ